MARVTRVMCLTPYCTTPPNHRYINNFCGINRLTVGFASIGPIKLNAALVPSYAEFQGTLIIYSPLAVGNPSLSSTPEENIDYCKAGGVDALAQNCLSATIAFGAGSADLPFGASVSDVFFYLSTNNVAITPRSTLCIVFGSCFSQTEFIGRVLGEAVINSLTVSQSLYFQRFLNSGVIVPTGYRLKLNATLFSLFVTTVDAVFDPVGLQLDLNANANIASDGLSLSLMAHADVFDPLDTFVYAAVTFSAKSLGNGVSTLLCVIANLCSLPDLSSVIRVRGDVTLATSFSLALRAQTVTTITGRKSQSVAIPKGFQFSLEAEFFGYPATVSTSADITHLGSNPRATFTSVAQLGIYRNGPFVLCGNPACKYGPTMSTTFSASVGTNAVFVSNFSAYAEVRQVGPLHKA